MPEIGKWHKDHDVSNFEELNDGRKMKKELLDSGVHWRDKEGAWGGWPQTVAKHLGKIPRYCIPNASNWQSYWRPKSSSPSQDEDSKIDVLKYSKLLQDTPSFENIFFNPELTLTLRNETKHLKKSSKTSGIGRGCCVALWTYCLRKRSDTSLAVLPIDSLSSSENNTLGVRFPTFLLVMFAALSVNLMNCDRVLAADRCLRWSLRSTVPRKDCFKPFNWNLTTICRKVRISCTFRMKHGNVNLPLLTSKDFSPILIQILTGSDGTYSEVSGGDSCLEVEKSFSWRFLADFTDACSE